MKMKTGLFALAIIGLLGLGVLAGCGGDAEQNPVPTARVQVMLIDAPSSRIAELHVRLKSVQLANMSAPVVELLGEDELPEDIDLVATAETPVILGTGEVNAGSYTYASLVIDEDSPVNRVVTSDGTAHPLHYERSGEDTADIVFPIRLAAGTETTLLFDFSAAASVRETPTGWVLTPQVFAQEVDAPVTFASLQGVVNEVDGDSLELPNNMALGLFIREDGGRKVALTEIDPETGAYNFPKLVPARYRITILRVDPDWKPIGSALFDAGDVLVKPGADKTLDIEIDL